VRSLPSHAELFRTTASGYSVFNLVLILGLPMNIQLGLMLVKISLRLHLYYGS